MNTNKRFERNEIASPARRKTAGGIAMTTGRVAVTIVSLFLLVYAAMLNPEPAFAGASVTVSGGTWAIGTKKASTAATSSSFTVTNAASGGTEDITISVGNSTSGWTPSTTAGSNQFVLRMTDVNGQVITATPYTLFTDLANNATSSAFTLYFVTPSSVTAGEGVQQTITVTLTATNWEAPFPCGNNLVKTHTAGTVAPVTKTVTYGTTSSTLTGSAKCWITQNLGAGIQASSNNDTSEPAAGWYWQFNRAQGFKHDGTTRTPTTTWDTTNDNSSATWETAKDPCALLLGTGWRVPTYTEWFNADANGGWNNVTGPYGSVLHIHIAGALYGSQGALDRGGNLGFYWSSTQSSATTGLELYLTGTYSELRGDESKAQGLPVRCLKD